MSAPVGLVGLGNMGGALAATLVAAGHELVTHDLAGPERSPAGATFVADLAELGRRAPIVVLSLPDGRASAAVAGTLAAAPDRAVTHVVDTSTVGSTRPGRSPPSWPAPASATSTPRSPVGWRAPGPGRSRS